MANRSAVRYLVSALAATVASAIAGQRVGLPPGADSATTPIVAISKVSKVKRRTAAASGVIVRGLPERR